MIKKQKEVKLEAATQQIVESTSAVAEAIFNDLDSIEKDIDTSIVTIEQLAKDFRKYKREQEAFRWEIKKIISDEVGRQIQPLITELNRLTRKNPRFIYVKFKFPVIDFLKQKVNNYISYVKNRRIANTTASDKIL